MRNAIAYIRVSTSGQEDMFGADAQKSAIEKYCAEHDLNIVDWYYEQMSGKADDRPVWSEVIKYTQNPPIEAVVVYRNDRVARDVYNFFGYKYLLRKNNVELISTVEDFGQFGVFAPVIETVIATIGELERETLTKRTAGGRSVKAKQGGYSGGRPPYGYKAVNGELIIDEETAPAVRLIFDMRGEGATMLEIAEELKHRGYKTGLGREFSISSVQTILGNEKTYRGYYKYGANDWVVGQHQPILTDEPEQPTDTTE